MLWLFGEGILSAHERLHKEICIIQGSLKIVNGAVSKWLDLLHLLKGDMRPVIWISVILLTGTRLTPGSTTWFSEH